MFGAGCSVFVSRQVFTVYVGLTASGYDMARLSANQAMCRLVWAIREADWPEHVPAYFGQARTDVCTVNPYWPRAFLLTIASLYLAESPPYPFADPHAISRHIQALDALCPADKDDETMQWVLQLPDAYQAVCSQPYLDRLWELYQASVDPGRCKQVAEEAESLVQERLGVTSDQLPQIVVIPNPLQAHEQTDIVNLVGKVYVIEAEPCAASCVHEILHHILSPALDSCRHITYESAGLLAPVQEDMLRLRYAWDNSRESWARTFEEHFMRAAQIWVVHGDDPASAEHATARQAEYGFKYVPPLVEFFQSNWRGIGNTESFIIGSLQALSAEQRSGKDGF